MARTIDPALQTNLRHPTGVAAGLDERASRRPSNLYDRADFRDDKAEKKYVLG